MLRAVEPSDGMRDVWMKTINDKRSPIVKGTLENTGVEDGWADLINIAQAFHWCPNYGKASVELRRTAQLCLYGTVKTESASYRCLHSN
ncbi:hypothetical protein BD769DRAFT_1597756 [Suillus cothurnatus]|nr:hypothetical protein BD769DRAFT_1597756 [Suillus cothurnatus]